MKWRLHIVSLLVVLSTQVCSQTDFVVYYDGLTSNYLSGTSSNVIESGLTVSILGGFVCQTNGEDATIDNQGIIELTGNWENNNTNLSNLFSTSAGTVKFIGTTEQTISGSDTLQFYNLEINNLSAEGVIASSGVEIENTLTLSDGILFGSTTSPVIMKYGSSIVGGSDSSYIDGPMRKVGSSAFVFPLGNGGIFARLAIGVPTATSTFEAQYINQPFSNTSSLAAAPTPALNNVSGLEYWNLSRISGSGNVTVTLFWETTTVDNITDCGDLRIAHWNGSAWENNHDATTITTGSCAPNQSGTVSTTDLVTSYSPFTFGSVSNTSNPLPVELLSFNAVLNGDVVDLTWSTASEINNDFFTIERSDDVKNFEEILTKKGAGNSRQILYYTGVDVTPLLGTSYYRLKQTDFDGMYAYSDIIAINRTLGDITFLVYPNPLTDENLHILLKGIPEGQAISIEILDALGRMRYNRTYTQNISSGNGIVLNIEENLEAGNYFVRIKTSEESNIHKLVVQ